jgi:regulator of protease activity HflC (stomatin/prohibitin superfamily)
MTEPPRPETQARPTPPRPAGDGLPGLQAGRLVGRLAGANFVFLVLCLPVALALELRLLAPLRPFAQAARASGAAGIVLAAGIVMVACCLACRAMPLARRGGASARSVRWVQAGLVPALATLATVASWTLRPLGGLPAAQDCFVLAGLLLVLAFLALVGERMAAALSPAALPEAAALRAVVLSCVLALAAAACLQAAAGAGFGWTPWGMTVLSAAIGLIAAELALRGLGRWFLPPATALKAGATTDSLLARMLAGSLSREGLAAPLRAQFGIDFSRSWALLYLRAALLPALVLTLLLCWGLTGLVMVEGDRRGVYRRFGAPVGVLHPGLHLVLPWPLGTVLRTEFGTVHEIAIGGEPAASADAAAPAEAPPPPSASRLWDQPHPGEISTLIASETEGRQSFQTVNADIRILYRIGLADSDAIGAATAVADPASLVREVGGRRIVRFFAVRRLASLLGDQREAIAEELRRALAADLAPFAAGIEVVGVAVEAIHPPAGAAAAYHAVQAAAIASRTAVAEAQGRARAAANEARQQAHQIADSATARAAETVQDAEAERVRFAADREANAAGGPSFLLERYFADLVTAFAKSPLTLLDHRLAGPAAPLIDLRPLAASAAPPLDDPD